ncbi:MAG TPA: hypothetical protein VG406_01885 [Isosphaeraceae bacterium]|nr:hypothetical protein [Isosphaeraceae bacterium]
MLAFYYAWYRTPEVSKHWLHWEGVQPERRAIASATDYPASGPYDSVDAKALDRQMRQMAEAGIDGPIVSWWGRDREDGDLAMSRVLDAAARHGRVVSVYYERIDAPRPEDRERKAADDLVYLIRRYTDSKTWLRVGDRPVIFVYSRALGELGPPGRWRAVRALVRGRTGVEPFLVADAVAPEFADEFDGIHHYSLADRLAGRPLDRIERLTRAAALETLATAREAGKLACGTIIPGYDDTKIRRPGFVVSRHGGRTYRAGWEAVIGTGLDWALVSTWNEWHEGTQVEPSVEDGDRELEATRGLAARFKDPEARVVPVPVDPRWKPLVDSWRGGTIGLLGGLGPIGADVLSSGLPCRLVSLRAFCHGAITARDCPILIYGGGEKVRTDFGRGRTLDAALRRFARAGGVMVVASFEPWPMNQSLDTGQVSWSNTVGLPLAIGFETPPAPDLVVRFRGPLAELGDLPFPTTGDPRFRPAVPPADGTAVVEPLATLQAADGRPIGHGLLALRYTAGPFAPARWFYAWFRIWDLPGLDRDDLIRRLLTLAARR